MIQRFAFTALMLAFAAPLAMAQSAPPTSTPSSPVGYPRVTRYAALSGSWLSPGGDFADLVEDGWAITLEGYQFINPMRKVAAGTEIGYYDFGAKKGPLGFDSKVWFVPVDMVLRAFPKSDAGRVSPFLQGGIGFNYVRTEVGGAVNTDIEFGAQAGVGLLLHGSGRTGFKVDGIYHWIFSGSNATNVEFLAVRGGIVVPMR